MKSANSSATSVTTFTQRHIPDFTFNNGIFTTKITSTFYTWEKRHTFNYTYEAFIADSADNSCSLAVVFSGIKQESDDHEFSTQGSPPPPSRFQPQIKHTTCDEYVPLSHLTAVTWVSRALILFEIPSGAGAPFAVSGSHGGE